MCTHDPQYSTQGPPVPELDIQVRTLALLCLQVLKKQFPNDKVGKTGNNLKCVCSFISQKVKKIEMSYIHSVLTKIKYGKIYLHKYFLKTKQHFPLLPYCILTVEYSLM